MSWDEVRTRLQQEIGKRWDVASYRLGRRDPQVSLNGASANGASAPPGRFFFSATELARRVELLQHSPFEVQIIHQANQVLQHRFPLLGYKDLDYGKEIDWHLDAVHGKRTPLIPWYKLNFLDFAQAGDHKITWELNRHQHLVTLAKAWLLTREPKYVEEAIAQWYSWQHANPYPLGVNWASSLEVAFRSLSWLWLHFLLQDYPVLPANFEADLQRALALNGRHIERYLSTYFSPNTHLLGEAVALFFIGTLYPHISTASRWKEKGWEIIQHEAQRQVRPDGVYFEQSLYYHVYALDFFLHARLLASSNGVKVDARFDDVLKKMLAVVAALAQLGPPDGFGDDDGGRVFDPRRNRSEHLADPLALGAGIFHDENIRRRAPLTEEAIWLFGNEAVNRSESAAGLHAANFCFPEGGLYIIAGQEPIPQQMVIDAGPQGTGRSGHGHADALSVKFSLGDRPWLIDAGTFCYISAGKERQSFRGTRAHNTLAVDGLDQAEQEGPFAWSSLPVTEVEDWTSGSTFTLFAGSHSGYERLAEPIRHRRFVFHVQGGFWLVRDAAEGKGSHLLETSWHFASDLTVVAHNNAFVASTSESNEPGTQGQMQLALQPVTDPQWKCELLQEHVSPAYGVQVVAPVVRCSARVASAAEHAMLLIPADEKEPVAVNFERVVESNSGVESAQVAVYRFDRGESSSFTAFAQTESAWTFGGWNSDASFLYFCIENQRVRQLIFYHASFVKREGQQVFSSPAPVQYLEWINRNGERKLQSSDAAAIRFFTESPLESILL